MNRQMNAKSISKTEKRTNIIFLFLGLASLLWVGEGWANECGPYPETCADGSRPSYRGTQDSGSGSTLLIWACGSDRCTATVEYGWQLENQTPVDGVCGMNNDTCAEGVPSQTGANYWLCPGFYSGDYAFCRRAEHGQCGLTQTPTCSSGALGEWNQLEDGSFTWTCLGRYGGNDSTTTCVSTDDDNSQTTTPPSRPPGSRGGEGTGSGGGSTANQDQHGDTERSATRVQLNADFMSSTEGRVNTSADVDFFRFPISQNGMFIVETTGSTFTTGNMWLDGEEIGEMESTGSLDRNFKISSRVKAGDEVIVAVEGDRGRRGSYDLKAKLLVGYLENPGKDQKMSGIGVLSGWICNADVVELEVNGEVQAAGYGTSRSDTQTVCGDSDNGFGLLYNWNHLENGEHEVVAFADGEEFGRATFTVATLGKEFLRGVEGETTVSDFPSPGEKVRLVWQQSLQNFMMAPMEDVDVGSNTPMITYEGRALLENPGHGSYQSGVSVISGWVCDAEEVEIEIDGELQPAAYGTPRADTAKEEACGEGDSDNGFNLLYNWSELGDGEHTVKAYADGEEFGRATFVVTTLGVAFVRGAEGKAVIKGFPKESKETTLEWQQNNQNFAIIGVKDIPQKQNPI